MAMATTPGALYIVYSLQLELYTHKANQQASTHDQHVQPRILQFQCEPKLHNTKKPTHNSSLAHDPNAANEAATETPDDWFQMAKQPLCKASAIMTVLDMKTVVTFCGSCHGGREIFCSSCTLFGSKS
jgi:hypothetical protein